MTKSRFRILVLVTVALLASPGIFAAEAVNLQLRWLHGFQFAGYYVAREKGFYEKAGLDVDIIEGGPDIDHIDQVINGQADYGVAGSPLIIEYLKGRPVKVMAAIFQHSPYAIMTRKSSGITTPQQLIGKSVFLGPISRTTELQAMLINEGVALDKLKVITRQPRDLYDPEIDAFSVYLTNEPFLWSRKGIETNIIRPQSYGIDFYGDVLFGSEDGLADEVRAEQFLQASLKGWQYAFDHPEETISIIFEKYNSQGRSLPHLRYEFNTLLKLVQPDHIPVGQQNPYRWQRIAQIYHSLGMAPAVDNLSAFIYDPERDRAQRLKYQTTAVITLVSILIIAALLLWLWNKSLHKALLSKTASLNGEISSHRLTQQKLERSLVKYKTLFSAFPQGITVSDDQGNIIEANDASETLLGVAKSDHATRTLDGSEWQIIRPDGSGMPEDEWPAVIALREQRTADCEMGVRRTDGQIVWLSVTAAPLPITDHGVVVTYTDISERKHAKDALLRNTAMLSRTESIAHIGSWQWEVETDSVTWSDELFRIFGLEPSSTAPSFAKHYKFYFPEDMQRLQSAVERAISQAKPYEMELRAIRSDGQTRYCHAAGFPESDLNGKVVRLYGFLQDNSEARQLQQALMQTQKMEAVGHLTGGIAHDFNVSAKESAYSFTFQGSNDSISSTVSAAAILPST